MANVKTSGKGTTKAASKVKATVTKPPASTPKAKKPRPTVIPPFADSDGDLKKLRPSDFPKTLAGQLAFQDYVILRATSRKERINARLDPRAKIVAQIRRLRKKAAKLETELAAETPVVEPVAVS